MLQNTLYTIENIHQQGENRFVVTLKIDPQHGIFKGHFPEQPVLPGVCLMEMVREILNEIKGSSFLLSQAQNIKFLKVVDPTTDSTLKFDIEILEKENAIQTNVTSFLSDGSPNFKIKAAYSWPANQ